MNRPPTEYVTVSEASLQRFIRLCLERRGLASDHAVLMATVLTDCDLRGVHSHGLNRLPMYCRDLAAGASNPTPTVRIVKDTPTAVIVDGDGGIGYLPMVQATEAAVEKARRTGIAIGMARNIGHYGAAGIYTRMCADAGMIGFSVQGASMLEFPNRPVATLGSPPMSFAFPASRKPHVVVDFDTHFFREEDMDLFERIPGVFFKSLGLVLTSKFLGGTLVGQMLEDGRRYQKSYPSHAGGGTVVVIDPAAFVPPEAFYEDVDRFHVEIERQMQPMPGCHRAQLPGGVEAELEERYRREGIPISTDIVARVEPVAQELGVPPPWSVPAE